MNRNATSPFGSVPVANIPRSRISKPHTLKTTFNIGKLVPIYCNQVLPGQTVQMDMSSLVRLATPVTPVLDSIIMDIYWFFVPNRFLWSSWERFLGANDTGSWTQTSTFTPPKIGNTSSTTRVYAPDDLGAYLGVYPANVSIPALGSTLEYCPMVMPINAYCKVWNDWFRDENFEKEIPFNTTSNVALTGRVNNFYTDIMMGYGLAPVCKTADVFTRCLPAPQKGTAVRIPAGDQLSVHIGSLDFNVNTNSSGVLSTSYTSPSSALALNPSSLGTINELRNAFAIQRLLERDARGGTRYTELLKAHFNVSNGDLTLGRSEYLGGKRFGINMNQVVQTSGLDSNSSDPTPLGNVSGYSVTGDKSSMFTKSFTEHGWLLGVCCTRYDHHTYSQGINPVMFANTRYDFYWPELANIGEVGVKKREIYAGSSTASALNNDVFGYQEAWYQYRYNPNRLSGYMATQVTGSLNVWHYGDLYASAPTLSADFMHETSYQLDRTLAVSSDSSHQFLADFFFMEADTLPMPTYSIPGLVDHA